METRKQLMDAIARSEHLIKMAAPYLVPRTRQKKRVEVHAAERLGIDRRTIQRWEKRMPRVR